MANNVVLPSLGEGILQATVSFWFFQEGQNVKEKDDIVELATDKAVFSLPSPFTGKIAQILLKEGDIAKVGDVLATIE